VAAIAAVIGGEAGIDGVLADDDGLGVRAALHHSADERRHGQTPLGVHRVQRASVEEVLQLHFGDPPPDTALPFTDAHAIASMWLSISQEVPLNSRGQWITSWA
jgi:hypothetical protein